MNPIKSFSHEEVLIIVGIINLLEINPLWAILDFLRLVYLLVHL